MSKCKACGEVSFFDEGRDCSSLVLRSGEVPVVGMPVTKVWDSDTIYSIVEIVDDATCRVVNNNICDEGVATFNNNLILVSDGRS